ncbi:MAG: ABC transporter substrate-binding protein [Bacillota bacterium]
MKKLLLLFFVLTLFSLSSVGMAVEKGGDLVVGLEDDPPMLDPHLSTAKVDRQVFQSLYDTVVEVNENMEIVPGLAKDWTVEEDGTRYVFELRDDVYFHDGTKFDAEAVKFNFERMLDDKLASPRKSELDLITEIEVLDKYKVAVNLEKSFNPFLASLADRAGMMVSPAAVKEKGEDFANNPVGSGPFKFVDREVQDKIELEKFTDYWKEGLPHLDTVTYKPYTDENVRVVNLTNGELDMIGEVPPKDLSKLKTDSNLEVSMTSGLGFQGIWVNKGKMPLKDNDLAQALSKSIDKKAIVEVVFGESAIPADSPYPPGTSMHNEDRETPKVDPVAAKKHLNKAGKSDGFELTLMVSPAPTAKQTAQLIQSMASKVGIDIELEQLEFGTLLDRLTSGNYQAALLGWSGRMDPDGNTYRFFHSEGGLNDSNYKNEEVDQILNETREVSKTEERKDLFQDLMVHLDRDLPYIFVYHPKEIKAFKDNVKGFTPYADGLLRLEEVWIEN